MYANGQVFTLIENLHNKQYHFLGENGHMSRLESVFKTVFFSNYSNNFCDVHHCDNLIIDKTTTFLIFNYIKNRKQLQALSSGYYKKIF